jgi:hypothetical protein
VPGDPPGWDTQARDIVLQRRFRAAGTLILIVGLLAAAVVAWRAVPDTDQAYVAMLNNTKRYEYQMELMGGKSNILASELSQWFWSLWHGRRLAQTLTVLSVGGSLACFVVAHRLGFPPPRRRS